MRRAGRIRAFLGALAALAVVCAVPVAVRGYALNRTVADKRNAANAALGACPQLNRFDTVTPGKLIDRRWHTAMGANIRTVAATPAGRISEAEQMIAESFAAWTGVSGTTLAGRFEMLMQTTAANACSSNDGQNTICFAQSAAFAPGVLAFTNTVTSDILGERFPVTAPPSAFIGEVLDADVLVNPLGNFSTPAALAANPMTFDLQSILIHELGHFLGFSHTGVWGAMMYPFAPTPGQFVGSRPTAGAPDAPLSDDDRAGLRVLYPDAADMLHAGSIRGRITPANLLSLAGSPAGVTGVFGAHVVAIDEATGAVAASTLSGWSCSGAGPPVFDGSYAIERLPVGRSYRVFAEPLDGPVMPGHMAGATQTLCRNATTDPGWPAQFACTVPPAYTGFTTRFRGQ